MAHKVFQILLLSFAVFCTKSVFGLKCYTCNSNVDTDCSTSLPAKKYLQECSHDSFEALRDLHQQKTLHEAETIINGTKMDDHDHDDHDAPMFPAAGHPGEDAASTVHPLGDKDHAVNHTKRSAETPNANVTEPGPLTIPSFTLPTEATFCRKISYFIPAQKNGINSTMAAHVRVIRSCGWIGEEKKDTKSACKWIGTGDGVQMDQCVCFGDGCNSGNFMGSLSAQTMILMAVMTAGYFYIL